MKPRQAKVLNPLREVSRRAIGPVRKKPESIDLIEIEAQQLQQELSATVSERHAHDDEGSHVRPASDEGASARKASTRKGQR